jgi:hypothetical protein
MSISSPSSRPPLAADPGNAIVAQSRWKTAPSRREIFALCLATCLIFVTFLTWFRNYTAPVDNFGDSSAYMTLASAIRHWNFEGVVVKQFWGLPYAMAALSTITRGSDRTALLAISVVASFAAVALAWTLWDGWIAGFFAVLNFDWLQRSYLGGSEPLFVALLFGSFLLARKERWLLAALLASLATVVRPLGIFALLGIGIALLIRRDWRTLLAAILIGAVVGGLYVLSLARHFNDPLANVSSYHSQQWQGGWLFGIPFYAIIKGTLTEPAPISNLVLSFGWIFLILVAIVRMARYRISQLRAQPPGRDDFSDPLSVDSLCVQLSALGSRQLRALRDSHSPLRAAGAVCWIPKDRRILWGIAVLSSILAAASAIGIANVAEVLRRAL